MKFELYCLFYIKERDYKLMENDKVKARSDGMDGSIVFYELIENCLALEQVKRGIQFTMPIKHLHDEYEIYYLIEGNRFYFINQQTYEVKKGSLVFVDQNQIHRTAAIHDENRNHERILLQVSKETLLRLAPLFGGIDVVDFFREKFGVLELEEEEQSWVEECFETMKKEMTEKKQAYKSVLEMKLAELLIFSARRKGESLIGESPKVSSSKHNKVSEIAQHLTIYYARNDSLDTLASTFFISKYYMCKSFKEVTGFTIKEYVNMLKIKEAEKYLLETDLKVTEIAEKVGFESITFFGKVFKASMGISPLKFRKSKIRQ